MKKKILFVMESLSIGGAEKSLVTILKMIDYNEYDVDLFLFEHSGDFMNLIPQEVNLLDENMKYKLFSKNRKLSFIKFFLRGQFKLALCSLRWNIGAVISKLKGKKLYIGWNNIELMFNKLDVEYDTSIAFLERKTIYFNVDKVNSKNKIGFIHNDYSKYPFDEILDRYYFKFYNKIPTVSEHCKDVLDAIFPEYKEKFIVVKNMVSKELIYDMAKLPIEGFDIDEKNINIVSVGRLTKQKGFDRIVPICIKLRANDINFKWYIVGDGEERKTLQSQINDAKLEDYITLVGKHSNPYKWINIADIYVQPSRFEGYGITVAEAKALNKPIVGSEIPEFKELLSDGKGLLAHDEEEFVSKIYSLINNESLRNEIINNQKKEKDDIEELKKLYRII